MSVAIYKNKIVITIESISPEDHLQAMHQDIIYALQVVKEVNNAYDTQGFLQLLGSIYPTQDSFYNDDKKMFNTEPVRMLMEEHGPTDKLIEHLKAAIAIVEKATPISKDAFDIKKLGPLMDLKAVTEVLERGINEAR